MYWRAFDKSDDLDGKIGTVSRLTELYLQRNQLDRLFTRLQHQERDDRRPGRRRPRAATWRSAWRRPTRPRATWAAPAPSSSGCWPPIPATRGCLQQLSKLAEEEGDLETAARYQKHAERAGPSDDGHVAAGAALARRGELEEAQAVWSKMAAGKSDRFRDLRRDGQPARPEKARAGRSRSPKRWCAKTRTTGRRLYRLGVALVDQGKHDLAAAAVPGAARACRRPTTSRAPWPGAAASDPKLQGRQHAALGSHRQATGHAARAAPRPGRSRSARAASLDNRLLVASRAVPTAWAPGDFGQARMASLGWLVALAERKGKAQADEVIVDGFRKAGEKSPADPRAHLGLVLSRACCATTTPARLAAGKLLEPGGAQRSAGPLGIPLFARRPRSGRRASASIVVSQGERRPRTPPRRSEPAELDHVMACFRSLRARRPELAQAQILQNVFKELKRAKRTEDEERLYRESIDGATQIGQLAGVFGLAAERGDVDGLLSLCDRYERLQSGRGQQYYYTGSFYFQGPAVAIGQCMTQRADRKAHDDVLKILDHQLAAARRRQERQSPGSARAPEPPRSVGGIACYQTRLGRAGRRQRSGRLPVAERVPRRIGDPGACARAFELYKRDDLMSDLVSHFRRQAAEAKTPADANYPRLALASDPVVERRQGRGDRRDHQGRRSVEARVGPAARPGRAARAAGRSRRGAWP